MVLQGRVWPGWNIVGSFTDDLFESLHREGGGLKLSAESRVAPLHPSST